MAIRLARPVDRAALERVVKRFDLIVPASQVRQIVERYTHEQWVTELMKNPRIVALAALPIGGRGIPWPCTYKIRGKQYLQSADRYRAQALLGDPEAKWEVYYPTRMPIGTAYIRRVF